MIGSRDREAWMLDLVGLGIQGAGVPALQVMIASGPLAGWRPDLRGAVGLHPVVGFLIAFVVVDYLYYWNHRLLHCAPLWPVHAVHHSSPRMDVLATSRNTLWTPALIVYLWAGSIALFALDDPRGYVAGAMLTAALDLWRHCGTSPTPGGRLHRLSSWWLILPADHAMHHGRSSRSANFGANFKLWDRLHGTHVSPSPGPIGIEMSMPLVGRLLWPLP